MSPPYALLIRPPRPVTTGPNSPVISLYCRNFINAITIELTSEPDHFLESLMLNTTSWMPHETGLQESKALPISQTETLFIGKLIYMVEDQGEGSRGP